MKNKLHTLILIFTLIGLPCLAQDKTRAEPSDLQTILEMLRSDMNSYKIVTINQVMKLTGPEAETFWPIYRQYETELAAIGDRRVALLKTFVGHHRQGTLDDKNAKDLAKRSLQIAEDRVGLWKKYHKKISKALSPIRGAQFLQIEYQMALFIDLNIASEVPVVESKP